MHYFLREDNYLYFYGAFQETNMINAFQTQPNEVMLMEFYE